MPPKRTSHPGRDDAAPRARLLLVDDEPAIIRSLDRRLGREAYEVHTATCGEEAISVLESSPADVILTDQRTPGMLGTDLLATVSERWPETVLTWRANRVMAGGAELGPVLTFWSVPQREAA